MSQKNVYSLKNEEEILNSLSSYQRTFGRYSKDQIWTGFPYIKYFKKIFGNDNPQMNELEKLENNIKSLILKLRQLSSSKETSENIVKILDELNILNTAMREMILEIMNGKKTELLLFYVLTCEELKKSNPSELKDMPLLDGITQIKENFEARNFFLAISKMLTDSKNMKRTYVDFMGTEKVLNSLKNGESSKKLKRFLKCTSGMKKMSPDEQRDELTQFCAMLKLDDLYNFINQGEKKNIIFTTMIYSIFGNYLLDLLNRDSLKPISERKYPELTEDYICNLSQAEMQKIAIEKYGYRELGKDSINSELIADCIVEYTDYFDMDSLFLTIMARYIDFFEKMSTKAIKEDDRIKFGDSIFAIGDEFVVIQKKEAELMVKTAKEEFYKVFNNYSIPEESTVEIDSKLYSIGIIKQKMKQFCGNYYLTPQLCSFIKYDILVNDPDEYMENKELLQRLNLKTSDIFLLSLTSSKDLKALYDAEIIDEDYLHELTHEILIQKCEKASLEEMCKQNNYNNDMLANVIKNRKFQTPLEFLKGALENGLLTLNDIKDLYVLDYIPNDLLDNLQLDEKEMSTLIDGDEIADMYKTYAEHWCDGSNDIEAVKKEKDRLMSLFYKYASTYNQLSDAEKEEFGIDILQKIFLKDYDELEKEEKEKRIGKIMREMRSDGFINYRCIESAGLLKEYISEAMAEDELNFVDCSEIKNAVSSDDMKKIVEKILDEKRLDDSKKYALVMNLLDDYNDETINKFEFVKDSSSSTSNDENHRRRENNSDGKKSNGWLYTDKTKWKFYGALDKDFKPERCANGFVIIYSPKLQKRFIEKLYVIDRNSKPSGLDYGTATYVINEDDYQIIKDELIVKHEGSSKDIIDVANMRRNIPRQDRISHITHSKKSNWMRAILRKVGINLEQDSRYTQEELERLEKTLQEYEKDYKELGELGYENEYIEFS